MGDFHSTDRGVLTATFGNAINVRADVISRNILLLDMNDSAELIRFERRGCRYDVSFPSRDIDG